MTGENFRAKNLVFGSIDFRHISTACRARRALQYSEKKFRQSAIVFDLHAKNDKTLDSILSKTALATATKFGMHMYPLGLYATLKFPDYSFKNGPSGIFLV